MMYDFILEKAGYTCTTFKATYTNKAGEDTTAIYAYLYSKVDNNEIKHKYVCACSAYRSQDGEYRDRFIPFKLFEKAMTLYKKQFSIVEELILEKIAKNKLVLSIDVMTTGNGNNKTGAYDFEYSDAFGGDSSYQPTSFMDTINNERLPVLIFVYNWLIDFHRIFNKTIENHIIPAYQVIMFHKKDIPVYNAVCHITDNYHHMIRNLTEDIPDSDPKKHIFPRVKTGQKVFQATKKEIIDPNDINLDIWREVYIGYKCADLALNCIAPSFPYINNWFYIQNTHTGGLFDNEAQFTKHDHSVIAKQINSEIMHADAQSYSANTLSGKKKPISSRFQRVSKKLQSSVSYSEAYLELTNIAIVVHSEYVGRTIRDIPAISRTGKEEEILGTDRLFKSYPHMRKHIFEYLYSFHCMNTKVGIVHADIHSNNVTIYPLVAPGHKQTDEKNSIMYMLGKPTSDQPEVYMFDNIGTVSMIIDFSRSVIGNYDMLKTEYDDNYAATYFSNQESRVLRTLERTLPKFVKSHRDKLKDLIHSNFSVLFKIFTGVDAIMLANTFLSVIRAEPELGVPFEIVKFIENLAETAEAMVVDNLTLAVEGKVKNKTEVPWVNLELIKKFFVEEQLTPETVDKYVDHKIASVFNYNNDPSRYSTKDYNMLPRFMQADFIVDMRKKHGIPLNKGQEDWLKFKDLDELQKVDELMNRYPSALPTNIDWMTDE